MDLDVPLATLRPQLPLWLATAALLLVLKNANASSRKSCLGQAGAGPSDQVRQQPT